MNKNEVLSGLNRTTYELAMSFYSLRPYSFNDICKMVGKSVTEGKKEIEAGCNVDEAKDVLLLRRYVCEVSIDELLTENSQSAIIYNDVMRTVYRLEEGEEND